MTEPTQKEMLEWWDNECITKHGPFDKDAEMRAAIRRLIEEGSRVSREFVEKWAEKWCRIAESIHEQDGSSAKFIKALRHIQDMLREAGVEVEDVES